MKPLSDSTTTVTELRERVEHFLWAESKDSLKLAHDAKKRSAIEAEIADVVIYALEFANICGIDLAAAIETKMAANAKKYPVEKAKGRADKYTEL